MDDAGNLAPLGAVVDGLGRHAEKLGHLANREQGLAGGPGHLGRIGRWPGHETRKSRRLLMDSHTTYI